MLIKKVKRKVSFILLIAFAMTVFSPVISIADVQTFKQVDVSVENRLINFTNSAILYKECYYVPLEEICAYFKMQLSYDKDKETMIITKGDNTAWAQVGNILATVNGEEYQIAREPVIINEVVYIPIDLLRETFGYDVTYNEKEKIADITMQHIIGIEAKNAAHINNTTPDVNDIKLDKAATTADGLCTPKGTITSDEALYYKFDISNLDTASFKSITLRLSAKRNYNSLPALEIYSVTSDWDASTISYNNQPEYDAAPIAKRSFNASATPLSYENPFPSSSAFGDIDIDLSDYIAKLDENSKYVNIRLGATTTVGTFGTPLLSVNGINTEKAPKLIIAISPDADFEVKSQSSKSLAANMNGLYYSNMKFLSKLGVIEEAAELPEDDNEYISRDEFVNYAVRLLNVDIPVSSQDKFGDIGESEYRDSINLAADLGFVSGGENALFRPYDIITFDEATSVLIGVLGAKSIASSSGGYPAGYVKTANRMKLYDDVVMSDSELTFKNAFQLLYNALVAPKIAETYMENSIDYAFDFDECILKHYFNAHIIEDVVYANEYTSLYDIYNPLKGFITIGDEKFKTSGNWSNQLLGYCVRGYYVDNNSSKDLIYAGIIKGSNVDITLMSNDIILCEDIVNGFSVSYQRQIDEKQRKIKLDSKTLFMINGNLEKNMTVSMLHPEIGTVKFIDNDSNGKYEVVIVTSYDDIVVSAIDKVNNIIYDKYDSSKKFIFDFEDENNFYDIFDSEGNKISYSDIAEGDVLSIARSNADYCTIYVSKKCITGNVDEIINGDKYVIKGNIVRKLPNRNFVLNLGMSATFYIDVFSNIVGCESNADTLRFGYLMGIGNYDDFKNKREIRIFSAGDSEEEIPVYECANTVKLDGQSVKKKDIGNYFTTTQSQYRAIAYKLNGYGQVTYIDTTDTNSSENSQEHLTQKYYSTDTIKVKHPYLGGKFIYSGDTFIISVPDNYADTYDYMHVTSIPADKTVNADIFTIGENRVKASVIVLKNYNASASSFDSSNVLSLVQDIRFVVDKNGDINKKLILNIAGNTTDVFVKEENYSLLDGIDRGDIVRYSINTKGKLQNIEKYYDYSIRQITKTVGNFNESTHIFGGTVYNKDGNYLTLSTKPDSVDISNINVIDYSSAGKNAYKYIADRNGIEVVKAPVEEIVDFKSGGRNATGILCQFSYGSSCKSIWIIELETNVVEDETAINIKFVDDVNVHIERRNPGMLYVLPSDIFTKNLYEITAWTDGQNTYDVGAAYVVPESDVELHAVWTYTAKQKFKVSSQNAAFVNQNSTKNDINSDIDGQDLLNGSNSKLYYKVDASCLSNMVVGNATLKFYADRGFAGDPTFKVYKVTEDFDFGTITSDNTPSYNSEAIAEKKYSASSEENIIKNGEYSLIELDVTKAFEGITEENPYVTIMITSSATANKGTIVAGVNHSKYAPVIECSDILEAVTVEFDGDGALGSMSATSGVEGKIITLPECAFIKRGHEFIGWTDGVNTYNAGDDYIIPSENITLKAVWDETGYYKYEITNSMAAFVAMNDTTNTIALGATGYNELLSNKANLFYCIDVSDIAQRELEGAKLSFYADRAYGGNPIFRVYQITENFDLTTLSWSNKPSYNTTPIVEKAYSTSGENLIKNGSYSLIELDVLSAFQNINSEYPYLFVMITSSANVNKGTKIAGVNYTQYKPYLECQVK